ncbi:MAG: glycosyltransferase family 2 protein [Rhodobacteraceae bacterium]|uniref:glycosyltransferase family 2 protein n=1 Tax=Albidovulum sp. TaxID=1872424 RepID=UPI001DEC9E48|nr:glycosyltransferase family 2 protein [uncultured Defluviimonas sp.]MCB2124089.1 glycosyltransferase family 2 protein [Paracoccaceae bacterium]MCC0070211.1 glycosyltransferase family 2 protein [Paracoccaceae bacterium]
MTDPPPSVVIRRRLAAGSAGGLPLLDAVLCPDAGSGATIRVFTRAGVNATAFDPAPRAGCAGIRELREVAGAVMAVAEAAPLCLALATGGVAEIAAAEAEWDLLAGRDCLFGARLEENAETVADWLRYHARAHGATGALILNRAPDDSPSGSHADFAERLGALIAPLPGLVVVILESPVPLGKAGLGPESHVFLAPDAPGKDRMERPDPDPWRAPLGEGLIHEVAKWRFLARARAVLCLDVTDLLAERKGGPSAFDLCRRAQGGVVLLVGRRIYPWRVRPGAPEAFGDHICRPFDARRGIARWGVAPDRAGLDNTWRTLRVAYARPDADKTVAFWRAMAIRVPGRKPAELAPKTSLVEDPALLDLARRHFGADPVRPPVSEPRAAPAAGTTRTCIVTTMKNEGPFILEWLAYHRAIGVTDFLVYTNDCTDGTDAMLDLLQEKGLVQHRANPFRAMPGLMPQHAALQAAESEAVLRRASWAICMDVDEFINVKLGDGTLGALYAAMGEANMISLTWRLFGNADVHEYRDRFVTEQFPLCAPELIRKPHQAWGFKTLFRTIDIYRKLGVHRPKGLKPDLWAEVRWINGSGRPMPESMYRNGWRSSLATYGYDWVQLNHYAVRSAESFLVKRDRGRVNHVDRDQGLNYWFRMNHNAGEDLSIRRMVPAARAEFDRLMADPEIRVAHEGAVAAHRAKIAELKARPDYAAFYAELTGERMEKLSRMLSVFGSAVFTAGPGVVPADLHRRTLPPGFFFTVEPPADAAH